MYKVYKWLCFSEKKTNTFVYVPLVKGNGWYIKKTRKFDQTMKAFGAICFFPASFYEFLLRLSCLVFCINVNVYNFVLREKCFHLTYGRSVIWSWYSGFLDQWNCVPWHVFEKTRNNRMCINTSYVTRISKLSHFL